MRRMTLLSSLVGGLFTFAACSSDNNDGGNIDQDTHTPSDLPDLSDSETDEPDTNEPDPLEDIVEPDVEEDTSPSDDTDTSDVPDVDADVDVDDGSCTTPCTNGFLCQDGACVCPSPFTNCGGDCVDLAFSQDHCGACFQPAQPEACDGIDNNCNGLTDETLDIPINPCEVSNEFGTCAMPWACEGTLGWACDSLAPESEICDGTDNNCNGIVDEGFLNPVTSLYDRDTHCGNCATNCVSQFTAVEHGYGRCDSDDGTPSCELVCCSLGDANAKCDGFNYNKVGNTCVRQEQTCTANSDCPAHFVCTGGLCSPAEDRSQCTTAVECPQGDNCIGGICGCAGDVFNAEAVPPNVMIVLDRSGSMGTGANSKWEMAKSAINILVSQHNASVRFGLSLYPGTSLTSSPSGSQCNGGHTVVEVGPNNAGTISSRLAQAVKVSGTPTGAALGRFINNYPALQDSARGNYIVLITDGESNCDNPPFDEAVALREKDPSIRTFVIGFGSGVNPNELNRLAEDGGTARSGTGQKYYQANDQASLSEALQAIAGSVMGCEYALTQAPPSADSLSVYLDGVEQGRDTSHANGWDINTNTNRVTFYGQTCETIRNSSNLDRLVFVYGCPNPIIINP